MRCPFTRLVTEIFYLGYINYGGNRKIRERKGSYETKNYIEHG
jgi:hypothetical protein